MQYPDVQKSLHYDQIWNTYQSQLLLPPTVSEIK